MTVQASNNQPAVVSQQELNVSVGRANAAERLALDATSQAAVQQVFGDMLPPVERSELKPSREFTAGVVAAVDAPICRDAADFVLARLGEKGLSESPVARDLRAQYTREPTAMSLAA